jgi:hypothetical protein
VNYTTVEDVPEGEQVLVGTFSLNGHPIVILFDSGASHDFISKACWRFCREPFFSGAIGSIQFCWVSVKGCHVQGLLAESICVAYMDWCKKHTCRVYHVSRAGCIMI